MTLLDRLKSQPRHANPDPAVRLAHVQELPLDDRDAIAAFARGDEDARVRKAAVGKLMDPAALGAVAASDADSSVRAAALEMLRDFALEHFEGTGEAEALAAVDATRDAKALAQMGRGATRESVAVKVATVLASMGDVHALGALARHAVVEPARRLAFERLQQLDARDELLAVAAHGDFKDTALGALELFADRASLEHVAERGRNKASAKRARGVLRAADEEAVRAERAALVEAQVAQAAQAAAAALAASEAARTHDAAQAASGVAPAVEGAEGTPPTPGDSGGSESHASDAAPAAAAVLPPPAPLLSEQELERREARLRELADEASAASADPDLGAARRRLTLVRREWKDLLVGIGLDPSLGTRVADAESAVLKRVAEAKESSARARQAALVQLGHLLERVEALVPIEEVSLKAADGALREVRAALGTMPQLPTKQDYDSVLARLKAAQASLTEKTRAMREALDWKRWSNVTVQERLCAAMEALAAVEDTTSLPKKIRELQVEWRGASDVPPSKSRALWQRFKAAHDVVWARCEAFFAEQAESRSANLTKKTALCEQAEALSGSTDWIRTADAIKALQAEWKTVGPAPRGGDKALWERFHAACDTFYRRRHDDMATRKAAWSENFAKKEALCAKAEALSTSTAWDETAAAIKQLQAEWKTIGPVKKTRSEAIWQRFHGACNRFFDAYARRHDVAQAEHVQARETLCSALETLAQPDVDGAPMADVPAELRRLLSGWSQELVHRIDPEKARQLEARFAAALDGLLLAKASALVGTDLDPQANRQRLETLVTHMETLAHSLAGAPASQVDQSLSPTARLASMLKEALASNTIGGKVEDDSRWRAAADEVDQAQTKWAQVGPVPREIRRALQERFARASRAVRERVGAKLQASRAGGGPDRGPGGSRSGGRVPGSNSGKGPRPSGGRGPAGGGGRGQERTRS